MVSRQFCQIYFMLKNLVVNYVFFPPFVSSFAGVSKRVFTDSSSLSLSLCTLADRKKNLGEEILDEIDRRRVNIECPVT